MFAPNRATLVCVLLTGIAVVAGFLVGGWLESAESPLPFDAHTWAEQRNVRYRMVPSLLKSQMLIGVTRDEVTYQLGPPDDSHLDDNEVEHLLYRAKASGSDDVWLELLVHDSRVVEAFTRPD